MDWEHLFKVAGWVARYNAFLLAAAGGAIGFGAVSFLRKLEGLHDQPIRWKTYNPGEKLILPLFLFFAALACGGSVEEKIRGTWYDSGQFTVALLLVGIALSIGNAYSNVTHGFTLAQQLRRKSELYHMVVVFPILTAAVAGAEVLVYVFGGHTVWSLGAHLSFGAYLWLGAFDWGGIVVDKKAGRPILP